MRFEHLLMETSSQHFIAPNEFASSTSQGQSNPFARYRYKVPNVLNYLMYLFHIRSTGKRSQRNLFSFGLEKVYAAA